jgi:hypothetical protein
MCVLTHLLRQPSVHAEIHKRTRIYTLVDALTKPGKLNQHILPFGVFTFLSTVQIYYGRVKRFGGGSSIASMEKPGIVSSRMRRSSSSCILFSCSAPHTFTSIKKSAN